MANDDRHSGETSRYGIGCIVGKLHSYHVMQFDPAALIRHLKLTEDLQLPKDFVIHSLRHTSLTRFGETGAEASLNLNQTAVEKEENDAESLQIPLRSTGDRP